MAYTQKGMYAEAISAHRKAIALTGETPRSLAGLAHAYGKAGQRGEALKLLARLNEQAKDEYVSGYDMAIAYMGLPNYEEALRWLEKAFEARDQELPSVTRAPHWWVPLLPDPRFQDLLRRLRLPV